LFSKLVVVINTQTKTAELTIPTHQLSSTQQKYFLKIPLLALPVDGVHLQLSPINYAQIFFALGFCMGTQCTPAGYACVVPIDSQYYNY